MRRMQTEVLVVGGGATGTGILRDLAMRGFDALLVEQRDLTHGTTGRFHGLLHSGGRYVVTDPEAAVECIEENRVLRRIMPHTLEDTSGFFVVTPWDDEDYVPRFLEGCRRAGIEAAEVPVAEALRREPHLNPEITHCFEVPDAAADAFAAARATVESAREHGATTLPYHEVRDLIRQGDRVVGARCRDLAGGSDVEIAADLVVNATGAWAGRLAALAGLAFSLQPGKGTMVALNHRTLHTIVNRCKPPDDGDIIVPIGTVAVAGTTDEEVPHPERFAVEPWEVQLVLNEADKLVPGISGTRVLRAWAGVRPLYQEEPAAETRHVSRAYTLVDHARRDGVDGLLTITGGKWGTFRQMAEVTVDAVCRHLGVRRPCRTHLEPLPRQTGDYHRLGDRLARLEEDRTYGDLVCECELVTRSDVTRSIVEGGAHTIDDVRRDTRMGMGPCQGGWCLSRVTGLLHDLRRTPVVEANVALRDFLQERWKGLLPVLWGLQLRQARLDDLIFESLLAVTDLPGPSSSPLGPVMYEAPADETTVTTAIAPTDAGLPTVAGMDRDVIVVGGGLAGLAAARSAAEAGASAAVLTQGWGTLAWHAGTVDVLGRLPDREGWVDSPADELPRLLAERPDHPYARVGLGRLATSLEDLRALCEGAGYPLEGSLDTNFTLPSGLGSARPTCLAPATMTAGDLRRRDRILVVGLEGYADLYPRLVADNLAHRGIVAHAVTLDVSLLRRRRFVTGTNLARLFEEPGFRDEVVAALKRTARHAPRIGFPAVLGLEGAHQVVEELSDRLQADVFEIPSLPPSVPGLRLQTILRRALTDGGIRVLDDSEVVEVTSIPDGRLDVITAAAARRQRFRARSVVLATGGILGGGIRAASDGSLTETTAGLAVAGPSSRTEWFGRDIATGSGHPLFRSGVATDGHLRPAGADDLYVAGALLAGTDPLREGSLEGIALATGVAAGEHAAGGRS